MVREVKKGRSSLGFKVEVVTLCLDVLGSKPEKVEDVSSLNVLGVQ